MTGVTLQNALRESIEPQSNTDYIFKVTDGVVTATTLTTYLNSLETKANNTLSTLNSHTANTQNPHNVTKAQVGLGNVDNTSDINKPISTATQAALDLKANKADLATVATSGSYNDLTNKPYIPDNIVVEGDLTVYAKKTDLPTKTSQLTNDSTYQTQAQVQTQINTLNTNINKKQYLNYDNNVDVHISGSGQTINLSDYVSIYSIYLDADPGTITLNLNNLTFPNPYYTVQFRVYSSNSYAPTFTTTSGAIVWIDGSAPTYDNKAHWLTFRCNSDKQIRIMSDAGTEG